MQERVDSANACESSTRGPTTNVVDAMQEIRQRTCQSSLAFYVSTIDLLIVGPPKKNTKRLRQTDGERFFEIYSQVEFAKDFPTSHPRVRDTYDTKQIVKKYVM